jgi:Ca-activated chloride channel family protein
MKKLVLSIFILIPAVIFAEGIRLSHIDTSTLLADQKVKLYVGMTDTRGLPIEDLKVEEFEVYESPDGVNFEKREPIYGFNRLVNYENGIQFLLMVDNSGSMYRVMRNGEETDTRIEFAKSAIRSFISEVSNPKDKAMLASYNTNYTMHTDMVSDMQLLSPMLDEIIKPEGDDGYTEIYGSINQAVSGIKELEGRKVIIILSDGENRPYTKFTGKAHPVFGDSIVSYEEPLLECQKEGITIFAVHYGSSSRDQKLTQIALETGGAVFNARNKDELDDVYSRIVQQLIHEYEIVYRASMEPAEKRYVKVVYKGETAEIDTVRHYFASTVFGMPPEHLFPFLIIPFLLGAILLYMLSRNSNSSVTEPSLSVLDSGGAKTSINELILGKGRTVIGSTDDADFTISGKTERVSPNHATVLFDKKTNGYTLISDDEVSINNTKYKNRKLEAGDVINVGGATLVFDDGKY